MTIRTDRARVTGLLTGALFVFAATPALASTLIVSSGSTPCPGAAYATIQDAVNAAAPHDEVRVCAGTYAEQIVIPAGKDGLVVRSSEPLGAVIQAPAAMTDPGDVVRINAARDVTLEGFTIAGPLPDALFCSLFPRTGVRVNGGGSATIRANRITDIRSETSDLRGCQNGVPILVGSAPEGETGTAVIAQNPIEAYQKTGVLVDNAGSSAFVLGNTVTGDGPNVTIAQNGIQVSNGADAVVNGNWIAGQIYSPSPLASALIVYLPGRVSIVRNNVSDTDYGIVTIDATAPEIRDNKVFACAANGIDLDEETIGTTGALVAGNESHDNTFDGIFVSPASKGNDVRDNRMFADKAFDAEDDSTGDGTAGTANRWLHDHCKTDNHGGLLCEP